MSVKSSMTLKTTKNLCCGLCGLSIVFKITTRHSTINVWKNRTSPEKIGPLVHPDMSGKYGAGPNLLAIWTPERPNYKFLKSHICWDDCMWNDTQHPGVVKFSSKTWFKRCIPSKHVYSRVLVIPTIVLCIDTLSKLHGFLLWFLQPPHGSVWQLFFFVYIWRSKKCHANNLHPVGCSTYMYCHNFTPCLDRATCFQTL